MTTDRAFLNVAHSLTGRHWVGPGLEADRQAEAMAQITRLPMASSIFSSFSRSPSSILSTGTPVQRDTTPAT